MKFTELEMVEVKDFINNYAYKVESGEWTKEQLKKYLFDHMDDFRKQTESFRKTMEKAQHRWQELAYRKAV